MRKKIKLNVDLHKSHYNLIKTKANDVLMKLKDSET